MNTRRTRTTWIITILMFCSPLISVSVAQAPVVEPPAPAVEEAPDSDWPAPELSVGFELRNSETEGIGELLIPVWVPNGTSLLFISPRSSFTDHSEEEYNFGVGYRQLLGDYGVILGANAYYDYRDSDFSNYGQWGVGVELLSNWIDARANYYNPENKKVLVASQTESTSSTSSKLNSNWSDPYATGNAIVQDYSFSQTISTMTTTRTFQQYEQALGGYDWEIGFRLPLPIEPEALDARIFAGYYDFDNDLGSKASGWKTRAEVRIRTSLSLYAGVNKNDDLTGSDWFAGALLRVPLNRDAAKSRWNADPLDLSSRMTEMVVRDRQVRRGTSDFIENPSLGEQTTTRSRKSLGRGTATVLDDVRFVNGDVGSSGDGTGERPFASIQEGADTVFGKRNIYVFNASGSYTENVVLQDGTTLWGSGSLVPAFGGKSFGSGIAPIVDGRSMGPSITVANGTTVRGFRIQNTLQSLPAIDYYTPWALPGDDPIDISRVGIFGDNVTDLAIYDNLLARNSHGALFVRQGDFDLDFTGNIARNNQGEGLWVEGHGNSGTFNMAVRDSRFINNWYAGLYVNSDTYDFSSVLLENSAFNRNGDEGAYISQTDTADTALFQAQGIVANDNDYEGLYVSQQNNLNALAVMSDVIANDNGDEGIDFDQNNNQFASAIFSNITARRNDDQGVEIYQENNVTAVVDFRNITARNNDDEGVSIHQHENDSALATLTDIIANNNGDEGVEVHQYDNVLAQADLTGISANRNDDEGVRIYQEENGTALVNLVNITANRNDEEGVYVYQEYNDIARANLTGITATHNKEEGVGIDQVYNSDVSRANLTDITANNNRYSGVLVYQSSSDFARTDLTGITASDNRDAGIEIVQDSNDQAVLNLIDSVGSSNLKMGIDISQSDNDSARANLTGVIANDNQQNGIGIGQISNLESRSNLEDISANNNWDDGLIIFQVQGTLFHSKLADVTAGNNGASGIRLGIVGNAGDPARGLLERINTSGNGSDGISIMDLYSGKSVFRGEQIVSANNAGNGVGIISYGVGALVLDFGGGTSIGQNSFYGNGNYDLSYDNGTPSTTVKAENNWWGGNADPVANGQTDGNVNAGSWLAADPNL